MTRFEYETIRFEDEEDQVKCVFMKVFYFYLNKTDLKKIGDYVLGEDFIEFATGNTKRFEFLLNQGFNNLTNTITDKKAIYVHRNSGIPLMGNGGFGIVDRDTNCIEIKPFCGCNLDCVYCSVDEGRRSVDFVVEPDYLVEELAKVISVKKHPVEVHIGCHGEPLLYSELSYLISEMKKIPNLRFISMDTNGVLLTEKVVDELITAGLDRFNLSINSLNPANADRMSGKKYPLDRVKKMAEYAIKKGADVFIAPVVVQGFNDEDMDELVGYAKRIGAHLGIQNFLNYDYGKKPAKSIPMDAFFEKLRVLEKKHNTHLILNGKEDFQIVPDTKIPRQFKKGEIVKAKIVSLGRFSNEVIAVANNRTISVYNARRKVGEDVKIRIIREKHNIYAAEEI